MSTIGQHFYPGDDAVHCNPDRCWRYNCRILRFLEQQLQETTSLENLPDALGKAKRALWWTREHLCYERLANAMHIRRSLIHHHTRAFNMKKFFTAIEAQCAVEKICSALTAFLETFSLHISGLEDRVPQTDIDEDKRTLNSYLGYVLGLCACKFDGVPAVVVDEWNGSKQEHSRQLKAFPPITEDSVDKREQISLVLRKCKWKGGTFALKETAVDDKRDPAQLARAFGEASCIASCHNSPFVVKFVQITQCGNLLLELGDEDLMTWLKRNKPADLKLKLQFLQQAAAGLADVHAQGLVHCNFKDEKLVIFNGRNVKISALSSLVPSTLATCTAMIENGGAWWVAPEVFGGMPHTSGSDIYSFGVVMHVVVAETQPYRGDCSPAAVYDKKMCGQTPCDLPSTCPGSLVQLMSECCSVDPARRPPSMNDVGTRLERIMGELASAGPAVNLNSIPLQEAVALGEPEYELPGAKYNKEIVGFLEQQLKAVRAMNIPTSPKEDNAQALEVALATGERLIEKHRKRVDIKTFYQSLEARDIVEDVCGRMFQIVRYLNKESEVTVDLKVPRAAFDRDRDRLSLLLNYVLEGEEPKGDFDIPQDWKASRQEHEQRMHDLPKTDESMVGKHHEVGKGGFSKVYTGAWLGRRVAVKEIMKKDGVEDIENRAEFFKDVLYQIPLDKEHVAEVYAITKSGQLLMELANKDLQRFCETQKLKWSAKRRILLQAAARLKYLHNQVPPLAHSDVKSSNFLVFGDDPETCTVKIADFGSTCETTDTRDRTARPPQGTWLWVAPELFQGKVLSLESDVYSFGMILYEIITGKALYGPAALSRPGDHLFIMNRKLAGEEPCSVDKHECPLEVQQLMKDCISIDPAQRPTMEDVYTRLRKQPVHWPPLETPTPTLSGRGLFDLLLRPLKVLANIVDVEEGAAFLYGRVVVLNGTLERIKQAMSFDGDAWQRVMPQDKWQELEESLTEFAKTLDKAENLVRRVQEYKGRLRMWVYAKALKTSLVDSNEELDRVDQGLGQVREWLGEAKASKNEQQANQLRRISWEGRPMEVAELFSDDLAKMPQANEDCIRYNSKKLEFLQKQMAPLQQLEECNPPRPEIVSPAAWTESMAHLKATLKSAAKFISHHKRKFNLQTFYSTYYAKKKIEHICEIFKLIVDEYKPVIDVLKGVEILERIPFEAVIDDREDLAKKLSFVLKGDDCDLPPALKAEWEDIRREHEERIKRLRIVNEVELKWHGLIAGESTYSVEYYGVKAIAKRMIQDGTPQELEDFAKFFTEAAIIESLSIQWVTRLIGISLPGLLVMEDGEKDLMQWYRDLQSVDWETKVRVMWEAAQGLKYVHDQELIHRSVSSHSYLVFQGDTIKLSNFSSATEITEVKTLSHRRQAALPRWIAPEIFAGDPHSPSSDVFSFGVVMHEVAALYLPYGLNPTPVELLQMKQNGRAPCIVPRDCPQALRDLMTQCCSTKPGARPSMAQVANCLSDVKAMLAEWK